MDRIYNFSPGPSMLPLSVLEQAQREMLNYQESGMSIMEMSHRSKLYEGVVNQAEASLRSLMHIPENYKVLFLQGGATMQFAQVPLNLKTEHGAADYVDSGNFASNAIKEAEKFLKVSVIGSSKADGYRSVPKLTPASFDPNADYMHITTNNTVYGTAISDIPQAGKVPLVADMSSNILAIDYDVSKFGLIYAGAQKNAGMAGVTIVIIRDDLLGKAQPNIPTMLDYKVMADASSLYNTPCTYGIYISMLTFAYLESIGGVKVMQKRNQEKAKLLYDFLDESSFYKAYAHKDSRSIMNVTFHAPTAELDDAFVKEAGAYKIAPSIKGYRTVGGMRASMYNAMPIEGVQALVDFMKVFESKHR